MPCAIPLATFLALPHASLLAGPALAQFLAFADLTPTGRYDSMVVLEERGKGHGDAVELVFGLGPCAVGRGAIPSEIWFGWLAEGRGV